MDINYSVQIEVFARRHFIKRFEKKYKEYWNVSLIAITAEFERIDNLLLTDKADIIIDTNNVKIIKTQFRIAGTKESAKKSGNRVIIAWHEKDKFVYILLVYGKTDLASNNKETEKWKKIIKNNYCQYKHLF